MTLLVLFPAAIFFAGNFFFSGLYLSCIWVEEFFLTLGVLEIFGAELPPPPDAIVFDELQLINVLQMGGIGECHFWVNLSCRCAVVGADLVESGKCTSAG